MVFTLRNFKLEKAPISPGLYFFIGPKNEVLYAGKAANLKERLRSYFSDIVSEKIRRLRQESEKIRILPLESEIDALIKEASFIKKNRPKYNVLFRDDKNYFYVGFIPPEKSREEFPRIFVTHRPKKFRDSKFEIRNFCVLGPYVNGRAVRETLRLIRKTFPYCTCEKPHKRLCLQSQLGLCPGYCCQMTKAVSEKEKRAYRANIEAVKKILTGKRLLLRRKLDVSLSRFSRQRKFEEAARIRDQILGLERVFEHRGLIQNFEIRESFRSGAALLNLRNMLGMRRIPNRIECFDASEISGKFPVGGMCVFVGGELRRSDWRLFKIKRRSSRDDSGRIREILFRRFSHRDWPTPDLILVDGGEIHALAAMEALDEFGLEIPVAAVAKNRKRDVSKIFFGDPIKTWRFETAPQELKLFLRMILAETHRFVISYHRRLRLRHPLASARK